MKLDKTMFKGREMKIRKQKLSLLFIILSGLLLTSCGNTKKMASGETEQTESQPENETEDQGYDLPVDERKKAEVTEDCTAAMDSIRDIYVASDHSQDAAAESTRQWMEQMQEVLKKTGNPVIGAVYYSVMENYDRMDTFLKASAKGEKGSIVLYKLDLDGGITRNEYIFDGEQMYDLSVKMSWNKKTEPVRNDISYARMQKWSYTERGNFCYELCVPEPPQVSELVDGSFIFRVIPLSEECRAYSEKYVFPIGYQGNNLLVTNWDSQHLEGLDYAGTFEYFYRMKYGELYSEQEEVTQVPGDVFESLMMEYLPITEEQLREWASYDEQTGCYSWKRWGCYNYTPTHIGHSISEVKEIRQNADGTKTMIVDAVCASVICDDVALTHQLTILEREDGSVQYIGNQILDKNSEEAVD